MLTNNALVPQEGRTSWTVRLWKAHLLWSVGAPVAEGGVLDTGADPSLESELLQGSLKTALCNPGRISAPSPSAVQTLRQKWKWWGAVGQAFAHG